VGALFLALILGICVGLRSLTPPAAVSWAAALYWIDLGRSRLFFLTTKPVVAMLTVLAIAELIADKLPFAADRTDAAGLFARIVLGGLSGACIAVAGAQRPSLGVIMGIVGALIGCFAGFQARTRLVKALNAPGFVIAILEDLLAVGGSLYVVTRF